MKRILYFSIGFLISLVFMMPFANAWTDCQYSPIDDQDTWVQYYNSDYVFECLGYFDDSQAAIDALQSTANQYGESIHSEYHYPESGVQIMVIYVQKYKDGAIHRWYSTSGAYPAAAWCEFTDTDGDGLQDNIDAYPNDTVGYQFKILSKYYDSLGNEVGVLIETSRGDTILLGTDLDSLTSDIESGSVTIVSVDDGNWYDSANIVEDQDIIPLDLDSGPYIIPDTSVSDVTKDVPESNSDPEMTTGQSSTGSETDSEVNQKLIDNTKATADNVSRLGDYLKSINSNLQNINSASNTTVNNTTSIVNNTEQLDGDDDDDDVDSSSMTSALDSAASQSDSSQAITDAKAVLEAEVTVDDIPDPDGSSIAKDKLDVSQMIEDLILDNPISDIINGVELEAVGSCEMDWIWVDSHNNSHNIKFSLCKWETQLNLFGSILLMMSTVSALVIILRG
jgi:hypothetical protein